MRLLTVTAVIDMAFVSFGDQRVLATCATRDTTVSVDMAFEAVHSLSRENLLNSFKERHRDKRFMVAAERLTSFQNANQANVEWIPQNRGQAVHAHLSAISITQTSAEHLAGELWQGMRTTAIQFEGARYERSLDRVRSFRLCPP